jgi:sugar lactone lactonase YvrE
MQETRKKTLESALPEVHPVNLRRERHALSAKTTHANAALVSRTAASTRNFIRHQRCFTIIRPTQLTPKPEPKLIMKPSAWRRFSVVLVLVAFSGVIASADTIFVSNDDAGTVSEFGPNAALINPSFASGLNSPRGLAFDSSGNLYVANLTTGTVSKFGPNGALLNASFASGLSSPYGLAFDGNGNLYAANGGANTVSEFNSTGTLIRTLTSGLNGPIGLAFSGGNLYVANFDNGTVAQFSSNGTLLNASFASGLSNPTSLAFDHAGNLYVASALGTVSEFSPTGTPVNRSFISSAFAVPFYGLAFDSGGNLWVTDQNDNDLSEYNSAGALIHYYTYPTVSGPEFIAIIPEPSAFALLCLSLSTLLYVHRRLPPRARR